jgi:aminopeptidase N
MKSFFYCLLLISFLPVSLYSQEITRADSLRGGLTLLRSSYDVKYYHLDIKIDTMNKTISGYNLIRFTVVNDLDRMQVDLFENMKIDSVIFGNGNTLSYSREYNAVFINLPYLMKAGSTGEIKVYYSGQPLIAKMAPWDGGFVWTHDKEGNLWIGTAVQGTGASLWWPNKDHQSDESDSMLISVTVPPGLMNISNGRLKNIIETPDGTRYDWFVSNPINNYAVTLNIGKYSHFGDQHINEEGDTLDLDYYVMPYNLDKAREHFRQVIPMMECFEKYFGKYPFYKDGFKLVETPYWGMEHQSAVAYGNDYEYGMKGRATSEPGMLFDYIIIHETAHEWWGNSVTSNDIADMWIHEGFGTYAETVYLECLHGYETAMKYINSFKPQVRNDKPIIGHYNVNKRGSGDMYRKGALMLNTLRHVINDDELWFSIIKGIAETFRHSNIDTEDIVKFINDRTGKDFTYFFDQYLRHTEIPELEIVVDNTGNGSDISYRWIAGVNNFSMPVTIIIGEAGVAAQEKEILIYPDTRWKKITSIPVSSLKISEEKYYIDLTVKIN